MTLGERLKLLRNEIGMSQEAVGAHGFVSSPGWIKIENGQRQASEKLIERFTHWLVEEKHIRAGAASGLKEELMILKYLGHRSEFVQRMAKAQAGKLPGGGAALLAETPRSMKPKRGRPRGTRSAGAVALAAETPAVYKAKTKHKSVKK